MLLLDGQSGIIVLDPTRDELDDAKTQVSRRHKLELQLEGVVDQPAVTPGRPTDPADGQRGPARGDRAGAAARRPGRRPAADRVPAHRPGHAADRGRAGHLLPPGGARVPRPHGHHPVVRPGRRQVPGRLQGAARGQPVPRLALHPGLPGRAGGVPPPDPGGSPGGLGPRRPADAAARHPGRRGAGDPGHRAGGGRGAQGGRRAGGRDAARSA